MLNIFTPDHGRLVSIRPDEIATLKPVWVDVIQPGEEERGWMSSTFALPFWIFQRKGWLK